jgi:hypothetical protein
MANSTNITKVFCLGDGYAHGHIWPEWPQLLQALFPKLDITVISAVGAGHEFLISELLTKDITNSLVIFQWPDHNRFDKLVQDQYWENIIQSDQIYNFNTYKTNHGMWWCSSASKTDIIQQYHNCYIQSQQSKLRQQNQKILIEAYLNSCAKYVCTSNRVQEKFYRDAKFELIWGDQIQPLPLVHYHWLVESIIPATGLELDVNRSKELLKRISTHHWIPYDPDRKEIWETMSNISLTD